MKKILVPTDFSAPADQAVRYAIHIANQFEAEIQVVHIYDVVSTTGSFISIKEILKKDAERDLTNNLKQFKGTVKGKTIIKGRAIMGRTVDTICSVARQEKVDLVIMGTQGASGLKGIFLGSNTASVMKRLKAPLLAIPNNFTYQPIKEIVLAADQGVVADPDVLAPMLQIIDAFKSNVKVVHFQKKPSTVGIDPGINFELRNVPHTIHHFSSSENINEMIDLFVQVDQADLLCMIRRQKSFWGSLFSKSRTTEEVFNCPVPLLVMQSED